MNRASRTGEAPPRDTLTQQEALRRAGAVDQVAYELALELDPAEGYDGTATVVFRADPGRGDTFVDFTRGELHEVRLNGRDIREEAAGHPHRLRIPARHLRPQNELRVRWHNAYDRGGAGFHRFRDPEDGEVYVYTDFEPYNAHRLFPCFDQPDLKATYDLTVSAPAAWEVVANGAELEREAAGRGRVRRRFKRLQRFSPYLFAVLGGPFQQVRSREDGLDLGLYCRKALRPHLDPEEIFELTRQGFRFYQDYFDQPYPFDKYDQIFVPEFNSGAMENVAAVTFNEAYVFRDPPSYNQRLARAEVILHELAHMWFGNLVTMRWWEDLWLNESFATYISYLAMQEATRFSSCWESFLGGIKGWALRQDEKPTTHPVAGPVEDTDQTFLNFDGITYGKGASTLKQLHALVGPEAFRDGLRLYFRRHAWGNTTLADFLAPLSECSGRDLTSWSQLWLMSSGVNDITPELAVTGDRLETLVLEQSPGNGDGMLRPHLLHVGLLRVDENGRARVEDRAEVLLEGALGRVPGLVDRPRPDLVWCNLGDHGYARFMLDPESLSFAREHLHAVEDPLIRQGLWQTLWSMTRDGRLAPADWLDLVARSLPREERPDVLESVMRSSMAALHTYLDPERTAEAGERLMRTCAGAVGRPDLPEGLRLIWARDLIGCVADPGAARSLLGWLEDDAPAGVQVDQGMRWRIILRASAFGLPEAPGLIAGEERRDPSDRGVRAAFAARAAAPDADHKRQVFEEFCAPSAHSPDLLKHAMPAFWWPHQASSVRPLAMAYFERLPGVLAVQDLEYASRGFARLLFPHRVADPGLLQRAQDLLEATVPGEATRRRILLEECDEMQRVVRLRAM